MSAVATDMNKPATPPAAAPATTTSTNWAPSSKVAVGVIAASVITLLMPFLKGKFPAGTDEAQVAAALTTLITFVIQYVVPERK